MSKLLSKLSKVGVVQAEILSESQFFAEKEFVPTPLPIINVAFSGKLDGGIVSGFTMFAGESKSFKTLLGLYCLKAYFDHYEDAIAIVYDSEFGVTPEYLNSFGIDTTRILHIPITNIEELKFDMVKRLEEIQKGDRVFVLIDSLGSLASKKEIEDAKDEKSVADMTRAKAIRSLLRIVTPHLTIKDIPCMAIAHVYKTLEMYAKTVVSGGTAQMYAANQVFIITKAQEKDGDELAGFNFTINVEKSRFVREKSKLPFTVTFEDGINRWSGLMDLALESGHVTKPKNGWYAKVDRETGEVLEKNYRLKDTNNAAFWNPILKDPTFQQWVQDKFALGRATMISDEEIDDAFAAVDEDA